MKRSMIAISLAVLTSSGSAAAQWLHHPNPGIPRTKDGTPNLSAAVPRGSDGRPDLSGVWQPAPDPMTGGREGIPRFFMSIMTDFKEEDAPMRPEAAALVKARAQRRLKDNPVSYCHPIAVPAIDATPAPYKIIQKPDLIVILYEGNNTFRQIFTDGRLLPTDPSPSWLGFSIGRWEGDTFVVDAVGFDDRSWLDFSGHPHSESMHVTERFHRRDFGHMDIQITIDDPKNYTKPITFTQPQLLQVDTDLLEYFCTDNERDTAHFR